MTHTDISKGTRVQSLWDSEQKGVIRFPTRIDKSAAEVTVLWDSGKITKEVYGCDIKIIEY